MDKGGFSQKRKCFSAKTLSLYPHFMSIFMESNPDMIVLIGNQIKNIMWLCQLSFNARITSAAIYILRNECNKMSAVSCTCENVQVTFHAWRKNRWLFFSSSTFWPRVIFSSLCLSVSPHGWKHTTPHECFFTTAGSFFCPINIKDMQ